MAVCIPRFMGRHRGCPRAPSGGRSRPRQGPPDPLLLHVSFSGGSMSMKLLLALAGAALIVLGTLAAVAVVSGPSPRLPVPWEGARTQVRAKGGGLGEVELDTTAPYLAYTLVPFKNTPIPGDFP